MHTAPAQKCGQVSKLFRRRTCTGKGTRKVPHLTTAMTCTGASSEDSSVPLWPGATAAAMAGLRLMECKRTKLTGVIFVFTFFLWKRKRIQQLQKQI
jgi:hypothetical protein